MDEKTYVADVAFEGIRYKQTITSKETERLSALLGAGYIHEVSGPVYAESAESDGDWVDDSGDSELLERFEDLDVVDVVVAKPRRGRPRKVE